jgi:hypothetical protein
MGLVVGRGLPTAVRPLKATTGSREGLVVEGHWDEGVGGVARGEGGLEEGPSEVVGVAGSLEQWMELVLRARLLVLARLGGGGAAGESLSYNK